MTRRRDKYSALEPERYELFSGPPYHFELPRREFFRALGGGMFVCLVLRDALVGQESGGQRGRGFSESLPQEIGAWLHIDGNGRVRVFTGKTEVGQNIRTSLAQVVCEELRVPMESVQMIMADTDLTPYDMGTFGSRTTPVMAAQLRGVAAAAREEMIELAARRWQADRRDLSVAGGKVSNLQKKESVGYGELTRGQKIVKTVARDVPTAPAGSWKVAGQSVRKVGGRSMVTGEHKFTSDLKRDGMAIGKVLRPPALNATILSLESNEAEKVPGVQVVKDGDFVGLVADDAHTAERALRLIHARWSHGSNVSGKEIYAYLKEQAAGGSDRERPGGNARGSVEQGLSVADKKLERAYTVAYIAHVPLEPRAAVAEWNGGKLTVWTGTQRPFGVRGELCQAFHLPTDKVRVIVPDTGSGYGGKHTGETAVEAARLAKAAGRPVKLVWTREEEFTWAYVRPAGLIEVLSGARNDGTITAWEFHNYNSGASAIQPLYDIPNVKTVFHPSRSPLRQGSYRGLAATANHFARETHVDEMAHALGIDPLQFRLRNIADSRLRPVLESAAERFGWGRSKQTAGQGFGIACGFEKGSYIASCAEVEVERSSGKVRVVRIVSAFECGAIVNPSHLRSQVEGAIIQGIGGALFEAVEFDTGKILNSRLSRYRVPRFSDTPELETVLLNRKDLPSAGAGETPIVCVAPAIGNAVFDASGVRLRSLPMLPQGTITQSE